MGVSDENVIAGDKAKRAADRAEPRLRNDASPTSSANAQTERINSGCSPREGARERTQIERNRLILSGNVEFEILVGVA